MLIKENKSFRKKDLFAFGILNLSAFLVKGASRGRTIVAPESPLIC